MQYAALCAEIEAATAVVLRKYGITAEQARQLDAHWQAELARDPDLRETWERARVTFMA